MEDSPVVADRATWLEARRELLDKEKALSRQLDELAQERRALPWVKIDKTYTFQTADGQVTLGDLFDGKSQLVVYHFMMGPDWDEGCPSCSFWADNFNGIDVHLAHRDTSFLAISRAPLESIDAYKRRMGWEGFRWVSSIGSDFNMDFGVSFPEGHTEDASYNFTDADDPTEEAHGLSAFAKSEDGEIYHTYSTYGRGADIFNGAYQILDLTAKGRDEDDLPWTMAWLHRHDDYPTPESRI